MYVLMGRVGKGHLGWDAYVHTRIHTQKLLPKWLLFLHHFSSQKYLYETERTAKTHMPKVKAPIVLLLLKCQPWFPNLPLSAYICIFKCYADQCLLLSSFHLPLSRDAFRWVARAARSRARRLRDKLNFLLPVRQSNIVSFLPSTFSVQQRCSQGVSLIFLLEKCWLRAFCSANMSPHSSEQR